MKLTLNFCECSKEWEGARFCVPSTWGGLNLIDACPIRFQIICIPTILHKDLSSAFVACGVYGYVNNVGLV